MVMEVLAFALMFFIIPNRKVTFKHASIAALITAILFEIAKSGFGIFVEYFSTYQVIFGALATIPLFLIWIYLSWSIILFGAEICHGLFSFEPNLLKKANHPFIQLVHILLLLAEKQQAEKIAQIKAEKLAALAKQRLQEQIDKERVAQEQAAFTQVSHCKLGTWVSIKQDDESAETRPLRFKLVVKFAATNKFIFVDKLGVKKIEYTEADLVEGIINKNIEPIGRNSNAIYGQSSIRTRIAVHFCLKSIFKDSLLYPK